MKHFLLFVGKYGFQQKQGKISNKGVQKSEGDYFIMFSDKRDYFIKYCDFNMVREEILEILSMRKSGKFARILYLRRQRWKLNHDPRDVKNREI